MSRPDLARRYARWVALLYPAPDRRRRGAELVDTYLALAPPGRRHPTAADIADLAAGGLRRHLRAAPGFGPGLRLAGLIALTTAAAFGSGWAVFEVLALRGPRPSMSLAPAAWVAWLLTAAAYAAAPGRWWRRSAVAALLVTVALEPAALLTGWPGAPLTVLVPQCVLGLVALGADVRPGRRARLLPLAAAVVTAPVTVAAAPPEGVFGNYYEPAETVLPVVGVTLLITAVLLALALAVVRPDSRGVWTLLILLTPIGMLALNRLGRLLDGAPGRPLLDTWPLVPTWPSMAAAAAAVATVGPALLLLALALAARSHHRPPPVLEDRSDPG
ncbi:hypothetical protein [Dactylosporangium matsuzakiense]|uniref:Uncharacterized protein n=1 Tax=Dactylosporangium matsuzakiense TaxID=53360 RepID=A0A9W6KNP8_9ACTN|nr:hypothetical protein [Dactylosporangium matsuzakiense]UWZ42736.1 hypothetical protein Dmats_35140 [Dactylosporangium matsuzakiense]GLL05386.1 hypothetical protein GCM10017581_071330 [Dactylosporangium matsuzakiense]